jgi:CxxC-x17-CxxC domain-containing protein
MTIQDKTLQCADCGANFTFTAREQEFFQTKGFTNEPKRCPTCRQQRRSSRGGDAGGSSQGSRQMYPATCAQCGKDTEVPFEPRQGRPVYCSDCFSQVRQNSQS